MTPEFKAKWLEKLTDGTYSHGRFRLVDEVDSGKRCCLGVALAIGQEMGLIPQNRIGSPHVLSEDELKEIGLLKAKQSDLTEANDTNRPEPYNYYPQIILDYVKEIETE